MTHIPNAMNKKKNRQKAHTEFFELRLSLGGIETTKKKSNDFFELSLQIVEKYEINFNRVFIRSFSVCVCLK